MIGQYSDQSLIALRSESKTPSGRRRKRIWAHGPKVPTGPSSASKALENAIRWQAIIRAEGVTRAEIARTEGCTRARVTQVMGLLRLKEDLKARLLAADPHLAG